MRAQLILPRFGVWAEIRLLVDTGSDSTIVHWGDRERLQTLDGFALPNDALFLEQVETSGIAGSVRYGREDAVLIFETEEGLRVVARLRVDIELTPPSADIPSLLGRGVLSEARLDFNMPDDELVLDWALA